MSAIAAIYASIDDHEAYAALPGVIAGHTGGRSCVIFEMDDALRPLTIQSSYFPAEQIALQLTREISAIDVLTKAGAQPGNIGQVNSSEAYWGVDEFRRTPFFNEAVRPFGDDTARAIGGVWRTKGGYLSVASQLGSGRRGFERADLAAMNELFSHVRRMLELRERVGAVTTRAALLESALDQQADAIFIVDSRGHLQLLNARAKSLLERGDGLHLSRTGLRAGIYQESQRLSQAISEACARTGRHGGVLRISRHSGPSLRVLVSPLAAGPATRALVVVNDAAHVAPDKVANLRGFYDLSQAEAEIAMLLARGLSPQSAANARGVGIPTVRTQIQNAMRKTDARGIAELVAVVVSAPTNSAYG